MGGLKFVHGKFSWEINMENDGTIHCTWTVCNAGFNDEQWRFKIHLDRISLFSLTGIMIRIRVTIPEEALYFRLVNDYE